MTAQGIEAVRTELARTARKNTAVICKQATRHGMKEIWRVGYKGAFSDTGAVPTNETSSKSSISLDTDIRDILSISHIASIAGMLHDIGKATDAFQEMIAGRIKTPNIYRHEWASLLMFFCFVQKYSSPETGDEGWLSELAGKTYEVSDWIENPETWNRGHPPFRSVAGRPLAILIGQIIVSHHRMPLKPAAGCSDLIRAIEKGENEITAEWNERYVNVGDCENNQILSKYKTISIDSDCLPMASAGWQARMAYNAGYLLAVGRPLSMSDVAIFRMARLAMMAADHRVSSEKASGEHPVVVNTKKMPGRLYANTVIATSSVDRKGKAVQVRHYGQTLTQHLLMVARAAEKIARSLAFSSDMPRIQAVPKSLSRRAVGRFEWQDDAADLASFVRDTYSAPGGFCVCMASTGTGKTIGTAKIMNAWSGGLRLSYALGLRALTRQTGIAYIKDVGIGRDDISVMIGGVNEARSGLPAAEAGSEAKSGSPAADGDGMGGSESAAPLVDPSIMVDAESGYWKRQSIPLMDEMRKGGKEDRENRDILAPPVMVCTIDHLAPASETLRGGDFIIPELRLMTSDLILDEIDDYSPEDMPAIARMVYLSGVYGRRVILASATITWAMTAGLFKAYNAGYACNLRSKTQDVPCLFIDEFKSSHVVATDQKDFEEGLNTFVANRIECLKDGECLHRARVVPIGMAREDAKDAEWGEEWVSSLKRTCLEHHDTLAVDDVNSGTKISVGLVKVSHVRDLAAIVESLFNESGWRDDVVVHVRPYHARYLLNHRSAIESMLDRVMSRRKHNIAPELSEIASKEPSKSHMFLVVATSVCEVGRDWDADFAVIEPSSVRAIIQLAGRVQRHRRQAIMGEIANVSVMQFRYRLPSPKPQAPEYGSFVGGSEREGLKGHGDIRVKNADMTKCLALAFPDGTEDCSGMISQITAIPRIRTPACVETTPNPGGFDKIDSVEIARSHAGFIIPHAPQQIMKDDAWGFLAGIGSHMSGLFQHIQKFRATQDGKISVTVFKHDDEFCVIRKGCYPSSSNSDWFVGVDRAFTGRRDVHENAHVRIWQMDDVLESGETARDCAIVASVSFMDDYKGALSDITSSSKKYGYSDFLGLKVP